MDPNKTTKSTEIKQKKPRSSKNDASEESELKKEMHRKCESRRRERINQYYDQLSSLLHKTAFLQSKKNVKIDRCSLIKYTNSYIRELGMNVNAVAKLVCKICAKNPELIQLLPEPHLHFILQSEYVDDEVCLMLATCFHQQYVSKCIKQHKTIV